PRPFARITLGLPHPIPQRLTRAADLFGNRLDGSPLRGVLALVLEHHPNRPLPLLGGVLFRSRHDSNLSKVGASGKPRAVQLMIFATGEQQPGLKRECCCRRFNERWGTARCGQPSGTCSLSAKTFCRLPAARSKATDPRCITGRPRSRAAGFV